MKKLFVLTTILLAALAAHAQKCVVLDFQIGNNVTAEEVEAVSYEFRSTFTPSCYTVEDYFRVKRIMKDLGYNPTAMNKEQIRRFGRDMVATVVVYGSLSKYMDEYSLDVLVMDVSSGTTVINQNTTFQKSEYRTHPRSVAKGIASKMCGSSSGSVSAGSSGSSTQVVQDYVDLGLPSGTQWKSSNEKGGYMTYDAAVSKYGNKLPTKEQWEELKGMCTWEWTGKGYTVKGLNGKSIFLPAAGYRSCDGSVRDVGSYGDYWSSTPNGSESAWNLYFYSGGVSMNDYYRCYGFSVRLVQD